MVGKDFNFIKSKKNDQVYKCIVSCDGDASKEGYPHTVKELQNFLGVMNFYWRFVPGAARLHRPLTEALKGSPRPTAPVEWTQEMRAAFQAPRTPCSPPPAWLFPGPKQNWP